VKGTLDRELHTQKTSWKTKLQGFLSVKMKNIAPGTGENKFCAAVRKSKRHLARAGKIAVSEHGAHCGLSLSCRSTVVGASAHLWKSTACCKVV